MVEFPNYLTLIEFDSVNFTPKLSKNEFMDGYSSRKALTTGLETTYMLKYHACTVEDMLKFEDWYYADLNHGANFFIFIDPRTNKKEVVTIDNSLDIKLQNAKNIDDGYSISFKISFIKEEKHYA